MLQANKTGTAGLIHYYFQIHLGVVKYITNTKLDDTYFH